MAKVIKEDSEEFKKIVGLCQIAILSVALEYRLAGKKRPKWVAEKLGIMALTNKEVGLAAKHVKESGKSLLELYFTLE